LRSFNLLRNATGQANRGGLLGATLDCAVLPVKADRFLVSRGGLLRRPLPINRRRLSDGDLTGNVAIRFRLFLGVHGDCM